MDISIQTKGLRKGSSCRLCNSRWKTAGKLADVLLQIDNVKVYLCKIHLLELHKRMMELPFIEWWDSTEKVT